MVKKKFEQQKWIHNANLYWIVNGKVHEEILMDVPYPIARKEKRALERTPDYRGIGKIVVVSARAKDQQAEIDKELKKKINLCKHCKTSKGKYRDNPYISEIHGISKKEYICDNCYNDLIADT